MMMMMMMMMMRINDDDYNDDFLPNSLFITSVLPSLYRKKIVATVIHVVLKFDLVVI